MKILITCTMLVSLSSALPAFSQNADTGRSTPSSTGDSAPVDLSGFREQIANKNKALANKVNAEKALVKKNAGIIQDAKRIDAANKKLEAERKQLDAQNAEFERERVAMLPGTSDSSAPSSAPQNSTPSRVESQPAHMELAGATVIPAGAIVNPNDRQSPVADPIIRTPPAQASQPSQQSQSNQATLQPVSASANATATVVASNGPMRVPENVAMGLLLSPIRPVYPQIAQTARVEGAVVLDAVIGKSGVIESLHAVSGPDMLRRAAMDAVQTAHYQPYKVNGENVQVATTITVVFRMRS